MRKETNFISSFVSFSFLISPPLPFFLFPLLFLLLPHLLNAFLVILIRKKVKEIFIEGKGIGQGLLLEPSSSFLHRKRSEPLSKGNQSILFSFPFQRSILSLSKEITSMQVVSKGKDRREREANDFSNSPPSLSSNLS